MSGFLTLSGGSRGFGSLPRKVEVDKVPPQLQGTPQGVKRVHGAGNVEVKALATRLQGTQTASGVTNALQGGCTGYPAPPPTCLLQRLRWEGAEWTTRLTRVAGRHLGPRTLVGGSDLRERLLVAPELLHGGLVVLVTWPTILL